MLKVKLSLCVFLILYAYIENARKESMRTWRMREKNLCVYGECAKRIYAYIENARKESMRTWRMHEKDLCVHGENSKRIFVFIYILTEDAKFNTA